MRTTAAVLALLLLPALVEAQEPAASERTHTVQSGETLGGIAQQYLGASSEWSRLFEANQDRIDDPDVVPSGVTLVIPEDDATAAAPRGPADSDPSGPAIVRGVQGADPDVGVEVVSGYEDRRELMQYRAFEPQGVPDVPVDARTVFYGERSQDDGRLVLIQPPEEVAAVPRAVFQAAGWLVPEEDESDRVGRVAGFAGDQQIQFGRTTVHPYDEVRVEFEAGGAPQVGDEFLVYRSGRSIEGVGDVKVPTAHVRVTEVDEGGVVAQVVREHDRMELGHAVARPRTFPLEPGVHPSESGRELEARLLAFQDSKELHLPGDFAFIDQGSEVGLQVGDELAGVTGEVGDGPGRRVARFQVVGVGDETSTVRILSTEAPSAVRPGLRLVLDRTMP